MIRQTILAIFLFACFSVTGQKKETATTVGTGTYLGKTAALRDYPTIERQFSYGVSELNIIDNDFGTSQGVDEFSLSFGSDPVAQRVSGQYNSLPPIVNFDGANASEGLATPPDPSGAAGPNHYVQAVNVVVKIYDKEGNLLTGPTLLGDFLGDNQNSGDPIVMYDHLADRWFVSQFNTGTNGLVIAISDGPDPTGEYNLYQFNLDAFPDYPHYAIWPDAYYLTANKNQGNTTYALDREAMLAGDENPAIIGFNLPGVVRNPNTVFSPEPANLTGFSFPSDIPGYIVYLQDDAWSNAITFDHLKIWEIDIDFDTPSNSTISTPLEVPVTPFDSFFANFGVGEQQQPGTTQRIDMISGVISFAANYRTFEDHNSWLITFNADADGQNTTSGIRWIELRNNETDDWSVFQEGTYAPDDGLSRFMGSGAMDGRGNIGLAFNIAGPDTPVGVSYTGRFDGDSAGEMTVAEEVIVEGGGVQTNTNRFGDYSHLTMDPNDFTFWHTTEYFTSNNSWSTRIAAFSLSDGFDLDLGVVSIDNPSNGILTGTESVTVTVRNFGLTDQSNIPITLMVDGIEIASEVITGPILSNTAVPYTFTTTADLSVEGQTYLLSASADQAGDESVVNNNFSKEVTHLLPNDIGITTITSPTSGLLGAEDVVVTVTNFGGEEQTNFEVQYVINNEAPVVEIFTGTLEPEQTSVYTFSTQATFVDMGAISIAAQTNLQNDQDTSNDSTSIDILNICTPTATDGCNIDGIKQFILNTINADDGGSGCNSEPSSSPQGYSDRTNLSTTLSNVSGQNEYVLQAQQNWPGGPNVEAFSVWIDFDDSGTFEESEQLIAGEFFEDVAVLESFDLVIPVGAAVGSHILRAKAIDTSAAGDINNPCSDFQFGEVQDYTVIIDDVLSTDDSAFANSVFTISTSNHKNFNVNLTTNVEGDVFIGVYNLLGQQLKYKPVQRNSNTFNVALDMSNVSSGVYFVKMMTINSGRFITKKIIVN